MNETVDNLFREFKGRVDKEVVEMVYLGCKRDERKTRESLANIASDIGISSSGKTTQIPTQNESRTSQPIAVYPSPSRNSPQLTKPSNIFEQIVKPSSPPVSQGIINPFSSVSTQPLFSSNKQLVSIPNNNQQLTTVHNASNRSMDPLQINTGYMKQQTSAMNGLLKRKPVNVDVEASRLDQADEALKLYVNNPNRRILCLMRGLPGSGKSYRAHLLNRENGVVYSTDDFFKKNGKYEFEPAILGEAHLWNQKRAKQAMEKGVSPIFIDNTNIQLWEMKPYVEQAVYNGYMVKILEPTTPWAKNVSELAKRNSHGVPKEKIKSMMERYESAYDITDILRSSRTSLNDKKNRTNKASVKEINKNSPSARRKTVNKHQHNDAYSLSRNENNGPRSPNFPIFVNHNDKKVQSASTSPVSVSSSNHLSRQNVYHQTDTVSDISKPSDLNKQNLFDKPINSEKQGDLMESLFKTVEVNSLPTTDFHVHLDVEKKIMESANVQKSSQKKVSSAIYVSDLENQLIHSPTQQIPSLSERKSSNTTVELKKRAKEKLIDESEDVDVVTLKESPLQSRLFSGDINDVNRKQPSHIILDNSSAEEDPGCSSSSVLEVTSTNRESVRRSMSSVSDEKLESQLKFLSECFPGFSRAHCRKWLGKYKYDLVRTCDYLARATQTEELPEDVTSEVIMIDDDEDEVDDGDHGDVEMEDLSLIDESTGVTRAQKKPVGEMYYCDTVEDANSMCIALDKRLLIEMIKRFSREDITTDGLSNEDLLLDIDEDFGRQMFYMWKDKVNERKRKAETILKEDEELARQLQQRENEQHDQTDRSKKKKRATALNVTTNYTNSRPAHISGLTNESNVWKSPKSNFDEHVSNINSIEKVSSGKQLNEREIEVRSKLIAEFPGVDGSSLDELIQATRYNYDLSKALIKSSCGLDKEKGPTSVFANDWRQVMSPPRKPQTQAMAGSPIITPVESPKTLLITECTSNDTTDHSKTVITLSPLEQSLYQTLDSEKQDYADFRTEAALQAELRNECFQKAAKANEQKQPQVAMHYAEQARKHTLKMKEAHMRAAEIIFKKRNLIHMRDQHTVDLHGLHADEAIRALKNFIENAFRVGHRVVFVITGRGNHSPSGVSTIRKAVIQHLRQKRFPYENMNSGGMLKVFLY